MSFQVVFKEDYGHKIRMKIEEFNALTGETETANLSGFTTKTVVVEKPNGDIVALTADFVTDGTDGLIEATATQASNTFNLKGYYKFQAELSNASQSFTSTEFGHEIKNPLR